MFLTQENKLDFKKILFGAIVTCALVLGGVFWFDIPVFNFLRTFDYKIWGVLGAIFSAKNWLVVSLIVLIIFYIKKSIQTKPKFSFSDFYNKIKSSYAFWIFSSVFLAVSTGALLKFIIGRARPIFYEAIGMTGFFPFTGDTAFHSMPSGHALASFAGLIMIGMLAPRAKWFTWGLAIVIAVSRVCSGFHWPADVIFGAVWGVLCADIVHAWMVRRLNK
ncbi:MAG: phosphatase PAP2 family protein [Alphaproteobacteria bacterium]|nr:phosphatase PAP2 family protein [Alphaproteobacteria bacterium]